MLKLGLRLALRRMMQAIGFRPENGKLHHFLDVVPQGRNHIASRTCRLNMATVPVSELIV